MPFTDKVRSELEKLTGSVDSMMENLRKMENPIMESRERLSQANAQLDKINSQTEAAAHQILDMVEQMIDYQEKSVSLCSELSEFFKRLRSKDREIYREKLNRISEMASASQNNAFLIMDTLQFQDITSQQMNHASSLLEDIESRLHNLFKVFDGKELLGVEEPVKKEGRAYDPDAGFIEGRNQSEVDAIVTSTVEAGITDAGLSDRGNRG